MTGMPTTVDAAVDAAIIVVTAKSRFSSIVAAGRPDDECHHIVKYTPAKWGGRYPPGPNAITTPALFVSDSPGFTWGNGVYACPVAYPVSGAIYGRCGVVSALGSTIGWRVFDATDPSIAQLYVAWAQQQPLYPMLTLTAHANWANHLLRNLFKSRFHIDVVVFHPDEFHAHYTNRVMDRWLSISEWAPDGRLLGGVPSSRVTAPRLSVILSEEFEATRSGIRRRTMIGPTSSLALPTAADLLQAYGSRQMHWVHA